MKKPEDLVAELKPHALKASLNSYSPYSGFPVGAAVSDAAGGIYAGCNVENASYGMTQCAERNALQTAIAAGVPPGSFEVMLIYTPGEQAHPPCGACRQVMHELMCADSMVISCCDGDDSKVWSRREHLPDPFSLNKD
jgi:cytidine deaminase